MKLSLVDVFYYRSGCDMGAEGVVAHIQKCVCVCVCVCSC